MTRKRSEELYAYATISPALIIVLFVVLIPIAVTMIYSFVNLDAVSSHRGKFVGLHYYLSVLSSKMFWDDLGRTLYYTLISTAIETVSGLLIALLLNQKFKGVKFLRAIVLVPWAIPTVVNGSLWKLIFNGQYGVLNALLLRFHMISSYHSWLGDPVAAMNAIVIADSWKMMPMSVIFFLAALQGVNKATYEAAMVDGANVFKRFFVLTLPYLKPAILVVVVMRTVEKFKAFDLFYIMTRGGPANGTKTLMYDTYLKAFNELNYSQAATYAYLITVFVLALTVLYQKILRRSSDGTE
jgi:multiple sugar transport system permease protein/N,N'-diacetylchitobiose transport system permease protein